MDLEVAALLEEEEKKAIERKRHDNRREEEYLQLDSGRHDEDDSDRRHSKRTSDSRGDLFAGRKGASSSYLKYENDNDANHRSSPKTPARDTPDRQIHKSRDDTRGASEEGSANGSARSRRHRSRSLSTGHHSRRGHDHYRSHRDDRRRQDDDHERRYRPRREDEAHEGHRSSNKRRADDLDMTDAPPASRAREDRSPGRDRPGSSYRHDRSHRDDRRYDDRRQDDDRYARRDDARQVDSRREERREPFRKKTPEPTDDERDLRTVFCQQLAARLRTRELKDFFEKQVGAVQDAQIVKDRVSGRSKGVGYVEFKEKDSIQKALGLTGHKLLGIPIIVTVSDAEKNRQAKANESITSANNNGQPYHRLYVGNIQFSITEDDITSLFESFGPLEFVQMQRDELGRSKGYGFVQFTDPKDAQAALENMNGQMLNGRPMRVGLGTTDKIVQEANASIQQRQAQTGSAFSGAGGRGGYASTKEDTSKGAGASALDDADVNGVSLNNVNRHELMRKLARIDDPNEQKSETTFRSTKPIVEKVDPTRCICLAGMWNASTTQNKGWQAETEEDVRQECNEKYGAVKHVGIEPNSQNGEVYVKFEQVKGGENAYRGLNGRYFDGQRISAKYVVDAVYNIIFPKAANL